ncbi:MAG: hypothetical protein CL394_03365 [Acidiferrobacteraceae bacterium]|jgi:uncharacterized protein YigA (DUF484 family)|nr:hypothetical protein [Acidiferrobacteraceae bacterium]MDP7563236.1 DUF484 family protein [Arenicellales bacterium]
MNVRRPGAGRPLDNSFEQEIAAYLRAHPDFFERHQHLLVELIVPHPASGPAVSLLERQVTVLRDHLTAERSRLQQLLSAAEDNGRLQQRLQHCFETIAGAADLERLTRTLPSVLAAEFDLDTVVLQLLDLDVAGPLPAGVALSRQTSAAAAIAARLDSLNSVCEAPPSAELLQLLPAGSAKRMASCALVPLHCGGEELAGWLVLGTRDPRRYQPDMDTVFLDALGGVVSAACTRLASDG